MLIQHTENLEDASWKAATGTEETEETEAVAETTLPREESDELLQTLQRHGRRRRALSTVSTTLKWTIGVNAVIGLGMYGFHVSQQMSAVRMAFSLRDWSGFVGVHPGESGETVISFGAAFIICNLIAIGCLLGIKMFTRKQARLSRNLSLVGDIRAVGPLTEALQLGDHALREEALSAVVPLLKELSTADTGLLAAHHREILLSEIERGPEELREAALLAFEQVGNEADAEVLEAMAFDEIDTARRPALQSCAAAIRQKVSTVQARNRYLRPSSAAANDDVLLRAAKSSTDSDPDTLLRPMDDTSRVADC